MIYFDNAATTRMDSRLVEVLNKYNCENFYNPSAVYKQAFKIQQELKEAKKLVLNSLKANNDDNILFTGSATEANNTVLFGATTKRFKKVLISSGEHASTHRASMTLAELGYNVEYIDLDKNGKLSIEDLKNKLTEDVGFVSFIHVSNETGAINDVKQITKIVKSVNPKAVVHCDGVQAYGKIVINLQDYGVDYYTISAHKVHGPKGIAALYIKKGQVLKPYIYGGGQQNGLRSGTENVSGIIALGELTKYFDCENDYKYIQSLKNKLVECLSADSKIAINSDDKCSPYIVSLSLEGVKGETIVHMLEEDDILVSTGSACSSKSKGNRILEAIGRTPSQIKGSVRVSFARENTIEEVEVFAKSLLSKYNDLYGKNYRSDRWKM